MKTQTATSCGLGWIPVTERVPEPRTTVLAYESSGNPTQPICVAHYNPDAAASTMLGSRWIDAWGDYIDVSHWMPLPEAPKHDTTRRFMSHGPAFGGSA